MRVKVTYECGCSSTLALESWSIMPDGELRACHVHGHPAGPVGHPARRPLSLTYHEEGGGD
jgi:hypothetical protein